MQSIKPVTTGQESVTLESGVEEYPRKKKSDMNYHVYSSS